MSEQITEEEVTQIEKAFTAGNIDEAKLEFNMLCLLVKAANGETLNPDQALKEFVNPKNTEERSFFPSMPFVMHQASLRTTARLYPDCASPGEWWADEISTALIGYKGYGGERAVEMMKAQQGAIQPPGTNISFMGGPAQQQKRGFLRRGQKDEKQEIKE